MRPRFAQIAGVSSPNGLSRRSRLYHESQAAQVVLYFVGTNPLGFSGPGQLKPVIVAVAIVRVRISQRWLKPRDGTFALLAPDKVDCQPLTRVLDQQFQRNLGGAKAASTRRQTHL